MRAFVKEIENDYTLGERFAKWLKGFGKHAETLSKGEKSYLEEVYSTVINAVKQGKQAVASRGEQYSAINKTFDGNSNIQYNKNKENNYERTDEFSRIQEESRGMAEQDISSFRSGQRKVDETLRERLSRVLSAQIQAQSGRVGDDSRLLNLSSGGNQFNIYTNVNGELFHDVFEIARFYLRNGELVTLHGVESTSDEIGYNDCKNYLSDDGLSGFSITPSGDLISVYNASGEKGFLKTIAPIVKQRARTLDCYKSENGVDLVKSYSDKFGFKTASLMDYNMEYDHDDIAKNHGMPKVAFMVNTNAEVVTKHFTKDQYNEAVAYQQSFIKKTDTDDVRFSLTEKPLALENIPSAEEVLDHLPKEPKLIELAKNKDTAKLG